MRDLADWLTSVNCESYSTIGIESALQLHVVHTA